MNPLLSQFKMSNYLYFPPSNHKLIIIIWDTYDSVSQT